MTVVGGDLIQVRGVRKFFPTRGLVLPWRKGSGAIRAVDGISFEIGTQETLSLVGESGCGKTTTSRLILKLEVPSEGQVLFRGNDLQSLSRHQLREYRSSVQAVFQDPWSSLNPRMRAGDIIAEPLLVNRRLQSDTRRARVNELLEAVGLQSGAAMHYPHEFSGGMRQRIAIARALALNPALIVLDEPVSALDVSIRAQIMNLLKDLQREFGLSYLLIAHDLATVRYLSDRIAVVYLGAIMEIGPSDEVFKEPRHPYTVALISAAMPSQPGKDKNEIILGGDIPSPAAIPTGCRFRTRCWLRTRLGNPRRCETDSPELDGTTNAHMSACHFTDELAQLCGETQFGKFVHPGSSQSQ